MFTLKKTDGHNIFSFRYDKCVWLSWAFIRVQEFYESPDLMVRGFKNNVEQLIEKELKEQGEFTYLEDWGGFNIPGHIWDHFMQKHKGELRGIEEDMAWALDAEEIERPFYIIGSSVDEPDSTYQHEARHGLWYLYDDYRRAMLAIIKEHPTKALRKTLLKMGYCEEVLDDEVQAYVLTGLEKEMKRTPEIVTLRAKLKKIEKNYWPYLL
ncbi:hypothetical protein KAR91_86950 [Candidatus Pacearchaeota archaeon]|nr:hypothetical protein [Candidatus Pacearchaeota archaeon]